MRICFPTFATAVSWRVATAALLAAASLLLFSGCGDGDPNAGTSTVLPSGDSDPADRDSLQQLVRLDDRYIAEFRIEGDSWTATGPRQEIALTFAAKGLSIRQVELLLEPSPASAFDLASAVFSPTEPLVTLPPGTETTGDNHLRVGAATLTDDLVGDRVLGTLTLKTSAFFNAFVRAHISIRLLSVGPSVSQRDSYEAAELNLGVVVN